MEAITSSNENYENQNKDIMKLFRDLNAKEVYEFKQWARDNYKPFTEISSVWHPIVREECELINKKKYKEDYDEE